MKTRNITFKTLMFTYLQIDNSLWSTTLQPAAKVWATPGALIHGNMKDPNAWSYDVGYIRHYKGKRYNYTNVSQPWYNTYYDGFLECTNGPDTPPWDKTIVYNLCLTKFNSKVRGELDLALNAVELRQSLRMLIKLRELLSLARLRGIGSTADLANGWLQWQYGWRPLVQDIFNILDELVRAQINLIKKVNARVSLPIREDSIQSRAISGSNVPSWRVGEGKQSCTISCTFYMPGFDLFRWSSLNPVSLLWEVIPYSFVVDWFLDIGSYLRNLETGLLYGPRFLTGYVSHLYVYDGRESVAYGTRVQHGTPAQYVIYRGMSAKISRRQFARTVLTSYPMPYRPELRVKLGWQRLVSGASLLRQLLG